MQLVVMGLALAFVCAGRERHMPVDQPLGLAGPAAVSGGGGNGRAPAKEDAMNPGVDSWVVPVGLAVEAVNLCLFLFYALAI